MRLSGLDGWLRPTRQPPAPISKTRSWSQAQARLNEFEQGRRPLPEPAPRGPRVDDAVTTYLDDCRARKLAESTIISYTNTLLHLRNFFAGKRIEHIDVPSLIEFRNARSVRLRYPEFP
jgi:hypothetical protein